MVLNTSLCFFRKPSNATCFIIYFNIYSQIRTNVTFKREGMIKIQKLSILAQGVISVMLLSQKYKDRVRKFFFLIQHYFQSELCYYIYIVIFDKHLLELYWIVLMCFYILDALLARRTSNIKSWTGQPSFPYYPHIQLGQERGDRNH